MDFFTVRTVTGRLLFVFVVLSHDRRRVHVNCTAHPTSAWTAQQLLEAFPEDTAPRGLLRHRDTIYDEQVRRRIRQSGYPGRGLESLESVAEPLRKAPDRFNPSGVSGLCDRAQRAASPVHPSRVSRLLPSEPHAFRLGQRCT
jgi:hypothetical protein